MNVSAQTMAYIRNGYLPRKDVPSWFCEICDNRSSANSYSSDNAIALFDMLMDELTTSHQTHHIVPISGGWDSRLILAALSERTNNVTAWTLGNPGQLDYDLGARVANKANVRHVAVSLDTLCLEWGDLCEAARLSPWTYLLDALFNRQGNEEAIRDVGANEGKIWSGFLGDPLTGGHFQSEMANEPEHLAQERFSESQRRTPSSLSTGADCSFYPSFPDICRGTLYEREFLDLAVRQTSCIAPIVLGGDWRGWTAEQGMFKGEWSVIAPFADIRWASWWLLAPREHHRNQHLYRSMALKRFPNLFMLPTQDSWGWPQTNRVAQFNSRLQHGIRNRVHRLFPSLMVRSRLKDNYLDFQWAFRKREDYREVALKAFRVLKDRETVPWIDLDKLWNEHDRGKRDHAQFIQILLSLAVNLEVHGEPQE